jgi:hypothetical protein
MEPTNAFGVKKVMKTQGRGRNKCLLCEDGTSGLWTQGRLGVGQREGAGRSLGWGAVEKRSGGEERGREGRGGSSCSMSRDYTSKVQETKTGAGVKIYKSV